MSSIVPERPPEVADIEAIAFEYEMAVATARLAAQFRLRQDDDGFVTGIAFVESFLVHARCLDEFLSSRGTYDDDVKASDFVDGFSRWPLASETRQSINHALQHITTYRRDGHMPWVPIELLPAIVEAMGEFIEELRVGRPELVNRLDRSHERAVDLLRR
jgi:hypothetical protein